MRAHRIVVLAVALSVLLLCHAPAQSQELLNVSFDATRELFDDVNKAFAATPAGAGAVVRQSHGGSGKQARAVIDGLKADVVTLALGYDVEVIASQGLLATDWQKRLPNNSAPFYSTIVLLVRKGNPKNIRDWDDLARPGVSVITPNPKTSGGARWNFLAAWGYGRKKFGAEAEVQNFLTQIYRNVPILDSGARAATSTFVQRGQGDVLIAWENEALFVERKIGRGQFEIVTPSRSILAEPPVALVDKNVDKKGTRALAQAYLQFLYSPAAQDIAGKHFYRPRDSAAASKYASQFKSSNLLNIEKDFGGWSKTQSQFFKDGAVFDAVWELAQQR